MKKLLFLFVAFLWFFVFWAFTFTNASNQSRIDVVMTKFYSKLDKNYSDITKRIDKLEKVNSKIEKLKKTKWKKLTKEILEILDLLEESIDKKILFYRNLLAKNNIGSFLDMPILGLIPPKDLEGTQSDEAEEGTQSDETEEGTQSDATEEVQSELEDKKDEIRKDLSKKQEWNISFEIPFGAPFNGTFHVEMEWESWPQKANGDIPFKGIITPDGLKELVSLKKIPISSDQNLAIEWVLNEKNSNRNVIKIYWNILINMWDLEIPSINDTGALASTESSILIDNKGVLIYGKVDADAGIHAFSSFEFGSDTEIEMFLTDSDDNWYLKLSTGIAWKIIVLDFPITNKAWWWYVKFHPKGADISGYFQPTWMLIIKLEGEVNQFWIDLSGDTDINVPISKASDFVNAVTDGAICGYEKVTDIAKCGYDTITDGAKCGTENIVNGAKCGYSYVANGAKCGYSHVTSGAECGYSRVTSWAKCGYSRVTSGAKCGYSRVTSGTKCGWDYLSWLFSGKKAKKCKVAKRCKTAKRCKSAKSCDVAKKCEVANKCEVAKSCKVAKSCEDLTKPKTCKPDSDLWKYIGDIKWKLFLSIKERVLEKKSTTKLHGKIVWEYCFMDKCYGLNEKGSSTQIVDNVLKICLPKIVFPVLPDSLKNKSEICVDIGGN